MARAAGRQHGSSTAAVGPGRDGRTEQDRAGLPKSAQEPGLLHDRDDRDATRVLHGELPDSDGLRQVVSTLISATPPLPQVARPIQADS